MRLMLVLVLLSPAFTFATDPPATDDSIRQLIEITEASKMMDATYSQVDAMMQNSMKEAAGGATFTPQQQKILDDMRGQVMAVLQDEMRWDNIEPYIISIYKQTFSEEEVQGLLDFYRSKAGQAMIRKMPTLMQGTMNMIQDQMGRLMPRLREIQDDTTRRLKSCCTDDS
ncbi:MAG: DUF2059 domain-containing protein [Steroidobacteraceae bacterium]